MGVWASDTGSVARHSVNAQRSGAWEVLTDTLRSQGLALADAYQYRLTLFTEQPGVSVAASDSRRHGENPEVVGTGSWGWEPEVPKRSEMAYEGGGEWWCSPAALSMVMAYWAGPTSIPELDQSVPMVAAGTYDHAYQGWGN
jgi:hypothetical protein